MGQSIDMKFSRTHVVTAALFLLAVAVGYLVYDRLGRVDRLPEGLIQANGRMEGDHVTVSSKFPGCVIELAAREGSKVLKGGVLIRIDDAQTRAKVDQAARLVDSLMAQVEAAHSSLAVLNLEVPLSIEASTAKVESARAGIQKAKAVEYEARRDTDRVRALLPDQAVSQQLVDQADARWKVAVIEIVVENPPSIKPPRNWHRPNWGGNEYDRKKRRLQRWKASATRGTRALAEAQSVLDDLTIVAPTNGTVTSRMVDVGEVVAAGAPLLELVDLDRLYLQVYVPELQIGKIRLDLPARIHTDAFPDHPFEATVRYIASKAEFTPKEVQTPDERVKLIYAVRLYLTDNPDHRLTPGLPADAVIRWKDSVAWAKPR